MAGYNFDTDLTVKPQQYGNNLGDIVNMARGVQAYQKQAATMPAEIAQAKAQSEKSQLDLLQNQVAMAGGAITGLENSEAYKSNDIKGLKKELSATKQWTSTFGHSPAIDTLYQQAEEHLNNNDVAGYKGLLAKIRNRLATNSEKYAAALPQFNANAQGTPYLTNRAAGTVTAPNVQGGTQNLLPTTPGVANFNDYQKDLTGRVGGAIQVDSRINEAEQLMNQFKPGAGARAYADIAQRLQAIGAPQDLVDKVAGGDLSATQSFNKFIAQAVTSGIGQLQGNPTANMMNDYLKNNPDVTSDPRALKRFFDFAHKQNQMAYDEQQFLLEKTKNKQLNPDTHVAEAQQHIREKYLSPEAKTQPKGNPTFGTYKTKDGRKVPVVSYDGGKSWEYK